MNSKYKILEYINQNKIIKYFKKKLKFNKMYYYFINFKYWNIVIIIVWIILYILGYLTIIRIIIFVEICFIIYIYKKMYEFLISQKCVEILKNKPDKFYYYIFKLNKISLLSIVISLELKIYNLIKWYQTYYLNKNNDKKDSLIVILISLLIPFKIFLNILYKFFYNKQILTLKEIIFKRAFGTILSVLIFTNILQMLIKIFETHINLLVIVYLIFSLKVWYDLKTKNQLELMYLGNFTDTLKIIKIRKNLLSNVVINIWKECIKDKAIFFENFGNNLHVLNYYILSYNIIEDISISNYNFEKYKIKMYFLNKIKRDKKIKDLKIDFDRQFYAIIIGSIVLIFRPLNVLVYFKALLKNHKKFVDTQINEIDNLIKFYVAQNQILLYIVWDIIILNKIATKKELIETLVIKYNDDIGENILDILWLKTIKPEDNKKDIFTQLYIYADYNYLKYPNINLNNNNLYEELYEISEFCNDCIYENIYFKESWKTRLYNKFYYWNSDFDFIVNGECIIKSFELWETPNLNGYTEELQSIRLKLIENYSELKINEKYIKEIIKNFKKEYS